MAEETQNSADDLSSQRPKKKKRVEYHIEAESWDVTSEGSVKQDPEVNVNVIRRTRGSTRLAALSSGAGVKDGRRT